MPKLSIIVPVYNGEKFLHRCLDSILAQKFTDFELVIIDDGSSDSSLEICREYESRDRRVVVFHKQNEGLVAARKSGLSIAKGDYIGFVDCDDYIDDNMYLDLIEAAERDNSDIVIGGIIIDYPDSSKELYNMLPEGFYEAESIKNTVIPQMLIHSGFIKYGIIPGVVVKIFKRQVLEKALPNVPNSINIGEDTSITSHSIMAASSISIVKSAAYHYIQGEDSMIRGFNPKRFDKICELYDCLTKIDNIDYKKQLSMYMSFLIFVTIAECVTKSGYSQKDIIATIKNILKHEMSVTVLKSADTSRLDIQNKIKLFLMRHCMIRLLILFI